MALNLITSQDFEQEANNSFFDIGSIIRQATEVRKQKEIAYQQELARKKAIEEAKKKEKAGFMGSIGQLAGMATGAILAPATGGASLMASYAALGGAVGGAAGTAAGGGGLTPGGVANIAQAGLGTAGAIESSATAAAAAEARKQQDAMIMQMLMRNSQPRPLGLFDSNIQYNPTQNTFGTGTNYMAG